MLDKMKKQSKDRVCLTTFIAGERYQEYIPFLVYSCNKAYPEYDILLFLHEKLSSDIRKQVELLNVQNVSFIEETFGDLRKPTSIQSMGLRWVLWDDRFLQYDYLYVVDIDMLYFKEPIPLHLQHIEHMKTTGLPFDNMIRKTVRDPLNLIFLGQRVKNAGLVSIFRYFFGKKEEHLLSGLHFINVGKYYEKFTEQYRDKYKSDIYTSRFYRYCLWPNNEVLLYYMMADVFGDISMLGVQDSSFEHMDFNNPSVKVFRPHHGIHLGTFRMKLEPNTCPLLNTEAYAYYVNAFKSEMLNDPVFMQLLSDAPLRIKQSIKRMGYYYDIDINILHGVEI